MERYIDKIDDVIEELQHQLDLFQKIISESGASEVNEQKIEVFSQNISMSNISMVKYFLYSLLAGEYIYNDRIDEKLIDLKEKIENLNQSAILSLREIQKVLIESYSCFTIISEGYRIFIKEIENKYAEENENYIFSLNDHFENSIQESNLSKKNEELALFFLLQLSLAKADHSPSNNTDYIENLITIEKRIERLDIVEFRSITSDIIIKIKFLKHKWISRKINEDPEIPSYSHNGHRYNIENYDGHDNIKLNEWLSIIDTQYELISKNWMVKLTQRVKSYKNKPFSDLKLLELHQLIKYYKDVKPDYHKLGEISKEIASRLRQNNHSDYNRYAFEVSFNYSLNNKFSLFIQQSYDFYDFKDVEDEYNIVKGKIKNNINNYFLEYKFLLYVSNFLANRINVDGKLEFIKKYESFITNICANELNTYYIKKEESMFSQNNVFVLPYEESLVPISSDNSELTHIFYASSFVLPPSSKKVEEDFKNIEEKFEKLNLLIDTGKYFQGEIKRIEKLSKDIQDKDLKSVEIISVFTAIITFILSAIPAYKFIKEPKDSFVFMFVLAGALSLFVIVILFITRNSYKNPKSYIPLGLLVFVFGAGFLIINTYSDRTIIGSNYKVNRQIEKIVKRKVDSVLKTTGTPEQKVNDSITIRK